MLCTSPRQDFFFLVFWFYNHSGCNKFFNQRKKGTRLVLAAVVVISLSSSKTKNHMK